MTRGRTSPQQAADTAPHKGYAVLLELLFASGPVRLVLGRWPVQVGADVYSPTGPLVQVDEHNEAVDGIEGLSFTLSGLTAGIFDLVVSEPYQGRLVRMLEARYDANHQAVGSPTVEYIGRMVSLTSSENQASRSWSVSLQTEQFDADARRPANVRFSDAEQRRRYPDDAGAEYAASLVERVMIRTAAGG